MRCYQKQSLAFMLDVERSDDPARLGTRTVHVSPARGANKWLPMGGLTTGVRGGFLCDEVGMGKTLVAIGLVLANPPRGGAASTAAPADGNRVTVSFKESGKMVPYAGVVLWSNTTGMQVRFDADQRGRREEMFIDAALDAWAWGDQTAASRPSSDSQASFQRMQSIELISLKATLIIVPKTLIGQWTDEIAQFAPALKVVTWHSCAYPSQTFTKLAKTILGRFATADVVLTTSTMAAKLVGYRFHRMLVDEVHTDDVKNGFKGMEAVAPRVWMLTGTPMTRGVSDMEVAAELLGQWKHGARLASLPVGPRLKSALEPMMIRHRKEQQIAGSTALSLPPASMETVWLSMSAEEKHAYKVACENDAGLPQLPRVSRVGGRDMLLEMAMRCRRQSCSNIYKFTGEQRAFEPSDVCVDQRKPGKFQTHYAWRPPPAKIGEFYKQTLKKDSQFSYDYSANIAMCTKLRALRDDLRQLRAQDPQSSCVIFTHHREMHSEIVKMLKGEPSPRAGSNHPITVYEMDGSTEAAKRHEAVREFQFRGKATGAKVLVVTLRIGAVGMTLTEAHRVYLMEPAFNPAVEVQAAGRIHRLGQSKSVLIKRFAFRSSLDAQIIKLHTAIAAGRIVVQDGVFPASGVKLLLGDE